MQPVTIYTTSTCPYCAAAKDLLRQKGADLVAQAQFLCAEIGCFQPHRVFT